MKTANIKSAGIAFIAGLSILTCHAQQQRNVGYFNGVKAGDTYTIIISQSDSNSVSVNSSDKELSLIRTEVKDSILILSSSGNSDMDATINVGIKSLKKLDITGVAEVKSSNQLVCDNLFIESNGAGDINLNVKAANEIKARISGVGNVTLKGTAPLLDAKISGSGSLKSTNLETNKAIVKVSGIGDAKVNALQSIDADVSGAGSIIYKGQPAERNINISGVGSVRESRNGTGDETASDTTRFQLGKKKYIIIDGDDDDNSSSKSRHKHTNRFKHWSGYEVGVNGFLNYQNGLDVPAGSSFMELDYPKSIQFGINLLEKDFHIYKNYVNIVTGFGFDFNHYALRNSVMLNPNTSVLSATNTSAIDYKKNTLNVSYIKVPLLLELNTNSNPNNNFHIAAGAKFSYRIHSVTKQKYELNNDRIKNKQRDDFNLEPFLCSLTARIGYNNVTVFADYSLTRLFKQNRGPQLYPFTIGVNIGM